MLSDLKSSSADIELLMEIAVIMFLMPIQILNKFVYSRLLKRSFHLSSADLIDLVEFVLVIVWYEAFALFRQNELPFPLFGAKEDSLPEIRLVRNIMYHIETNSFHMDYLLAAITALLWFRSIMLLRLSEQFGPIIEMIFALVVLVI